MNLPPTPAALDAGTGPRETSRDAADPRATQDQRDRFEQLLRAKAARQGGDEQDRVAPDAAGSPVLLATLPFVPYAAPVEAPPPAAGAVETVTTGPRAAIEAALNASPPAAVTPVGGVEPAAVWEASVHEPNSVPVEVRLTRPERAAHEVPPGWTLTVASSAVKAEVLARHAPRLDERLRRRAIDSHVRIERDDGHA